jgi:hypothetical protein
MLAIDAPMMCMQLLSYAKSSPSPHGSHRALHHRNGHGHGQENKMAMDAYVIALSYDGHVVTLSSLLSLLRTSMNHYQQSSLLGIASSASLSSSSLFVSYASPLPSQSTSLIEGGALSTSSPSHLSSLVPNASIDLATDRISSIVKTLLTRLASQTYDAHELQSLHRQRNQHITALQMALLLHRSYIHPHINRLYDVPSPFNDPLIPSSLLSPAPSSSSAPLSLSSLPLAVQFESSLVIGQEMIGSSGHYMSAHEVSTCGLRVMIRIRNQSSTPIILSHRYVALSIHVTVDHDCIVNRYRNYQWCIPWTRSPLLPSSSPSLSSSPSSTSSSIDGIGVIETMIIIPLMTSSPTNVHITVSLTHLPPDAHTTKKKVHYDGTSHDDDTINDGDAADDDDYYGTCNLPSYHMHFIYLFLVSYDVMW